MAQRPARHLETPVTAIALRQELSRDGYGASEVGAILSENPYKSPIDLWLEKTGRRKSFEGNAATEWGHDEEVALRLWYARNAGVAVWQPRQSLFSAERPWMRATPDGIALLDADIEEEDRLLSPANWSNGFEAKRAGWRVAHRWGEPGTDQVPAEYLLQCQHSMYVTGLDRWDLVATIGGEPPVVYPIHRDEVLIETVVFAVEEFREYVQRDQMPPVDGATTWKTVLDELYPFSGKDVLLEASREAEDLAAELQAAQAAEKESKATIERVKNQFQALIGAAAGVETSLGKVTCKPRRGNPDEAAIIKALAERYGISQTEIDGLRETCRYKTSRPVQAYWRKR